MKKILGLLAMGALLIADIKVGEIPKPCTIQEKDGGYVQGGDFNTSVLRGKIHVVIYADPDEKNKGEALNERLDELEKNIAKERFQKYLVINLHDTWKPNFIINAALSSRQKSHPESVIVKDERSVLCDAWGLEHDAYICLILDEKGKLIYKGKGAFSHEEIEKIVALISSETARLN